MDLYEKLLYYVYLKKSFKKKLRLFRALITLYLFKNL